MAPARIARIKPDYYLSVLFVLSSLTLPYLPMVKRKQVVQVEAEPAVQVNKVKKLVKKRADPSDPEAPIGKDHPNVVDISD